MGLQNFKDRMALQAFGMTVAEAHNKKICVDCKKEMWLMRLTQFDMKEWQISGLCPACFDKNVKGE